MRSRQESQRERFENRLKQIFARHHIAPLFIDSPDYHQRFLDALRSLMQHVFHHYQDIEA